MTLPELSHDSLELVKLHARWMELQRARGPLGEARFSAACHELAKRLVAHRSALFTLNADLQATHAEDDTEMQRLTDANQEAIKFCTITLGEMNEALGRTSLPAL